MTFFCSRETLSASVSNIQRVVSSNSNVPALEGILMTVKDGKVVLSGYDLEIGMKTSLDAEVEEAGSVVVNAKLFGDIIRKMPEDTVKISTDDKGMILIKAGKTDFSIVGLPPEDFPELPAPEDGVSFHMDAKTLKSMIRQTIFAAAQGSEIKPILNGVLFETGEEGIRLVALDGYRMAIRFEPLACSHELHFVVPAKALNELSKLIVDQEDVQLSIGKRHISFVIDSYVLISRLLEGEFHNYRASMPGEATLNVKTSCRGLADMTERLSLLIEDRLKTPVRIVIEESVVKASCATARGRAFDEIGAEVEGGRLEVGFNQRYLLDALRACECDEIRLTFTGALAPMCVLPLTGESFFFMVLPVRIKSEM